MPSQSLGSARALVRAGFTPLTEDEQPFTHAPAGRCSQTRVILVVRGQRNREPPFPDLKGQAPLRTSTQGSYRASAASLFLTSKVRLHCDTGTRSGSLPPRRTLFLTSKVRLHCDKIPRVDGAGGHPALFLTSKVRLHCDGRLKEILTATQQPFS